MERLSYRELIMIPTFTERYEYLNLAGRVGEETFGFDRYLNQQLYQSKEWRAFRSRIIARDGGYDMAHSEYPINGLIIVHHINPLVPEDFAGDASRIFDPNNVVAVSHMTHEAIHYGDKSLLPQELIERRPYDTVPWR